MALLEIHLNQHNTVRQQMTTFTAIVPEGKTGPFPVFYLLHGLSDDHTAWVRRSNVERYVDGLPLIVVMPNGERSFYTDSQSNPRAAFETYITHDLVRFVDATFQTIPSREGRVIAGLSMGGYGALKLAVKHPDLFRAAVGHSGAVAFANQPFPADRGEEWGREWIPVFGAAPQGGPEDLFALTAKADPATLPALRIDCGVDDFLIDDNRRFHAHLDALGIAHHYVEHPGAHTWSYWDKHILDTLAFFSGMLGLPEYRTDERL